MAKDLFASGGIPESVINYWQTLIFLISENFWHYNYVEIKFYKSQDSEPLIKILRKCSVDCEFLLIQDEITFSFEKNRGQLNFEFNKDKQVLVEYPKINLHEVVCTKKLHDTLIDLIKDKGSIILVVGIGSFISDGEKWVFENDTPRENRCFSLNNKS